MATTDKPKPKTAADLKTDTLDMQRASASAESLPWSLVESNSELADAFAAADKAGWFDPKNQPTGATLFAQKLKGTTWFKENNKFVRKYLLDQEQGGDSFAEQVRAARGTVQSQAAKLGATLDPTQLDDMARQYLMNGWGTSGREDDLAKALTGNLSWTDDAGKTHAFTTSYLDPAKGDASKTIQTLKATAEKNGVFYDDSYYTAAARAIAGKMGTVDDYLADIRKHAASANPVFADKINAGFDLVSLASPYLQKMADTLEINPNQLKLNDPLLKEAFGQVDDKGNPVAMGLWDFEKKLRKDTRWQYTSQANKEIGDMTQSIVKMFGFGG